MADTQSVIPIIRDADRGRVLTDMQAGIDSIVQGGNPQLLEVRLRYGLDRGALAFKLVLTGADKVERDAFRAIGERVRAETSTPVYYAA